jgi:hypothetical protein
MRVTSAVALAHAVRMVGSYATRSPSMANISIPIDVHKREIICDTWADTSVAVTSTAPLKSLAGCGMLATSDP